MLPGNQPGNYVPPSGEPITQVGQQAFDTQFLFNDGLLQTVNGSDGLPAYYIRGPDFHRQAAKGEAPTACRVVRVSDGMELLCCGDIPPALAFALGLVNPAQSANSFFGSFTFGATAFGE
jgi:hypothetical protein